MKKVLIAILLTVGLVNCFSAQELDSTKTTEKQKPKIVIAINFGAATIKYKPAFISEALYGLKYKKNTFAFNYTANELTINDAAIKSYVSKPVYSYQNFGYVHFYDLIQQVKSDVAVKLGVHYAEFGLKDVSTTSFFHTGNMLNIDRLVSFTPGLNYRYGMLNVELEYRYSIALRKSNVYEPKMTNGLTAKLGIRISK